MQGQSDGQKIYEKLPTQSSARNSVIQQITGSYVENRYPDPTLRVAPVVLVGVGGPRPTRW